MSQISCKTKLFKLKSWTIALLPKEASMQLPSRGIVMIKGTINGTDFQTVLEPDGRGSHWFKIDGTLAKTAKVTAGDTVTVAIEPTKDWIEPDVPADIQKALAADKQAHTLWEKVTPMAHWEWLRWIRATNKDETRARRIETARSKMRRGERRPCCFNTSMCTEPSVSKGGVLLEPAA